MSKWIKNIDTIDHTWVGQLIEDGTYYELQSHEESTWANNSQLLSDIGAGKAIVAKDDSGTTDITDINSAINYLKDGDPKKVKTLAIKDPDGKRARLKGIISGTATNSTTTDFDYKMEQLEYPVGTNVSSIFDGVQYRANNAEMGDSMQFQIVDKDGLAYAAGTVLEEFGDSFYVSPDVLTDIVLYESKIVPGMYIRIKYTSTGTTDVKFICNLYRHLKE